MFKRILEINMNWHYLLLIPLKLVMYVVATLALGSWPKQRACKGVSQEEAESQSKKKKPGSHITNSREC